MKKLFSFLTSNSLCFNLKTKTNSSLAGIFSMLMIFLASTGCTRSEIFNTTVYKNLSAVKNSDTILIDATHDGGGWWYPQPSLTGFSESDYHQGKAFADLLRSKGFTVVELSRNTIVTNSLLQRYKKVIRAGSFGSYQDSELEAYDNFLKGSKASLFLIADYKRPDETDRLAEMLGITFAGIYAGNIDHYAPHETTLGATPFYYATGSIVTNVFDNPKIQPLGWLDSKNTQPVMGTLRYNASKIFFLGDINGIEGLPQPLTDNIINWLFE